MDQTVASGKSNTLSPIGVLFSDSWHTLTQSMLSLFVLNVLGIAIYLGLGIVAILLIIVSGAGSFILKNGIQGIAANLPAALSAFIIPLAVISVIFTIIYAAVGSALQISSIQLIDSQGSKPVGGTFKKSFGLVIPSFLVGILIFLLTFGSFFVLIFPAILVSFLLSFASYEVILNNQRGLKALKSSASMISKNFGAIFIRWLAIILIYLVIAVVVPNLLSKIGPEVNLIVGLFSIIINLLLGWYMMSYQVTLYKQVREASGREEDKSMAWIWIVAALGWVIAILLGFIVYKTVASGILSNIFKNSAVAPGFSMQRSVNEMKPEAKVHYEKSQLLFKQLKEVQKSTGKSDAQIIAETKKINDENISELKKALEIDPENAKLWYQLGAAYTWVSSTGSLEEGLQAYQKAENLDPDNVVYINGVGDMLIRLGKYEDAILHFQKTLRLTKKSGFANLSVAQAYNKLKIYDSAREHYNAAIEIFTNENKNGSYDVLILQAKKELSGLPE